MSEMDCSSVEKLLQDNPNLVQTEGKIKCLLTGHEIPSKVSAIEQYLHGKKYKRLTKDLEKKFDYSEYEPMIVPSTKKGHEKHLFCTLTLRHINKTPPHVLRHVSGKKYQRAKERWDVCQKDGSKFIPTAYLNRPKAATHEEEADSSPKDVLDQMTDNSKDNSDSDDLADLYPSKYFEELSLDANENHSSVDVSVGESSKRKRTKHPTKVQKLDKPSTKKKSHLMVYS